MSKIVRSTTVVAVSTLFSRILGFVRDMLMANYFGAKRVADIFYIAFMIPNLFRRLVAEGALTISFIPVYTDYLVKEGDDAARQLAQKTLSLQVLIMLCIITGGIIFSPELMSLFFKKPVAFDLSVDLTRIMFPYLFFVGFVAFSMGVLNSKGYFFAPAIAPVLLNVGFIIGILYLGTYFSEPLYGVAIGVLLGGLLQLLLQIPYLLKSGFRFRLSIDPGHPGIRKIFGLILPALFGIAVYQVNQLVMNLLATRCPEGSVAYIFYTNRLTEIVLGIFIVSIGNVILPEMSRMSAVDDTAKLRELYTASVSAVFFLAIPAAVALMTIGKPIISVFFMRGEFSAFNAHETYRSLFFASIGIGSVGILRITAPTFYSMKDTRTPVIAATVSFLVNISLGYYLMQTKLLHAGLTLAYAVSATVQMLILFIWLQRRIGRIDIAGLAISLFKILAASAAMAGVIWPLSGKVNWDSDALYIRVIYLLLLVFAGGAVYGLTAFILKVREIHYFLDKVMVKMGRKK